MLAAALNAAYTCAARWRGAARERPFRASGPRVVYRGADPGGDELLHLYTVTFGNPSVVGHQIRLLRKYLLDDYHLTVVDNSPDECSRLEIESLCRGEGTAYVGLPPNPFPVGSRSHGAALNWVWYNVVEPSGRRFTGFLDHDIYPRRPTALAPLLESSGVLGVRQVRGRTWYLWPGWCFFDRARLGFPRLDFMPEPGLDTGGGNWRIVFRHLAPEAVPPQEHRYERFYGPDGQTSAVFEVIGDWVHSGRASGWDEEATSRQGLPGFLDAL